jgi:hypothetical protein
MKRIILFFALASLLMSENVLANQSKRIVAKRSAATAETPAKPAPIEYARATADYDRFNITVAPWTLFGLLDVEFNFRFMDHWAVGAEYFTSSLKASSGNDASLSAKYSSTTLLGKYYLNGFSDSGMYFGAGIGSSNLEVSGSAAFAGATLTVNGVPQTVGTSFSSSDSGRLLMAGGGYYSAGTTLTQQIGVYGVSNTLKGYTLKFGNNGAASFSPPQLYVDYKIGFTF